MKWSCHDPGQEPEYLTTRGIPLGIRSRWAAPAGEITLSSGDVFLLTSDGVTEATIRSDLQPGMGSSNAATLMLQQTGLWELLKDEGGTFGVDGAAQFYFNKSAHKRSPRKMTKPCCPWRSCKS